MLDALNVGMLMMNRSPEDEVQKAILEFVTHYGLLGLMTALPTTPSFMDYEAVYLPKNHFIKAESMETEDYLALFYPFDQLDLVKKGIESRWSVSGDNMMVALTMTFADEPMAKPMSFQREYAEAYDWVAQQFKDWEGTAGGTEIVKDFLKQIKKNYPKTVFHGTDVGHTWHSTGPRYLKYLKSTGQMDTEEYQRALLNIQQGTAPISWGSTGMHILLTQAI